uniref:ubiquitinyl hydrolase 1 n=1 Tax=Anolis carolinensis TaxID=28377 RepID=G1KWL9_ANOCA
SSTGGSGGIKKIPFPMQRTELAPLLKMLLCPGDSWCLIDYKWFKKWQRYVGFERWDLYYAGKPDYYPGPIDNAKLFEDSETQTLKKYHMDKVDYEVIPIEAWNKLVNWHGCTEGQRPIDRKVVEYGEYFKYCRVEVYPSELKPSQNNDSTDHIKRVHCVAGKDECNYPQQHVNLWNAPQSETSMNCARWHEEDPYEMY